MKNQKKEEKEDLNKEEISINKGFELMLRKTSNSEDKKKKLNIFEINFEKMFCIFNRRIRFGFVIFGDIKKKSQEN